MIIKPSKHLFSIWLVWKNDGRAIGWLARNSIIIIFAFKKKELHR